MFFFSASPDPRVFWVLLGCTRSWVDYDGFHRDLLGFTGFYWV